MYPGTSSKRISSSELDRRPQNFWRPTPPPQTMSWFIKSTNYRAIYILFNIYIYTSYIYQKPGEIPVNSHNLAILRGVAA